MRDNSYFLCASLILWLSASSGLDDTVPTSLPSSLPSQIPSSLPTLLPTSQPSSLPSSSPFTVPTSVPTSISDDFDCIEKPKGETWLVQHEVLDLQVDEVEEDTYVVMTPHPYPNCSVIDTNAVIVPGASAYNVSFDPRTSTEAYYDVLKIYEGSKTGPIIYWKSGSQKTLSCHLDFSESECRNVTNWYNSVIASGKGLYIEFISDSTINDFGVHMTIQPVAVEHLSIYRDPLGVNAIVESGTYNSDMVYESHHVQVQVYNPGDDSYEHSYWYKLDFGSTATRNGEDYVKVYLGPDSSGDLLYTRSGKETEGWPSIVVNGTIGVCVVLSVGGIMNQDISDSHKLDMLIEGLNENYESSYRINSVAYEGQIYSTIADVPVDERAGNSQAYYAKVPIGWSLAPDSANVRHVIKSYEWNTKIMVIDNGYGYATKSKGEEYAGERMYADLLHCTEYNGACRCYEIEWCQILIVQDAPVDDYDLFGFVEIENVFRDLTISFMVIFIIVSILFWSYQKGHWTFQSFGICCNKRAQYINHGPEHRNIRGDAWEAEEAVSYLYCI